MKKKTFWRHSFSSISDMKHPILKAPIWRFCHVAAPSPKKWKKPGGPSLVGLADDGSESLRRYCQQLLEIKRPLKLPRRFCQHLNVGGR